jgi:drug/metabolite transporter (DMT)-like permease
LNSILFGLASALSWGGGDFVGGVASRKTGAYRTVMYAEVFGLFLLFGAAAFWGEPFLGWPSLLLAGLAGLIGSTGLLVLYQAMISGQMSIATPVSALLAAVIPVLVGMFLEGLPGPTKILGFLLALAAIWFVAQETGEKTQLRRLADLRLPLFSGLCFGLYFIIMHQVSHDALIWPMIASRTGGALVLLFFMLARRESWHLPVSIWPLIVLNTVLDIGGNAFYILGGQSGRMDVAAVLGSLYPGATVILAWLVLKEKINPLQKVGILLALLAIALMTISVKGEV